MILNTFSIFKEQIRIPLHALALIFRKYLTLILIFQIKFKKNPQAS